MTHKIKLFGILTFVLIMTFTLCQGKYPQFGNCKKETTIDYKMVDPSLDDPSKPWCYFTHPVTCIGVPFMPSAVQVTPEGNIFTGNAEFCLFWGKDAKPMASRQRQFLDGYIPIVYDTWSDEDGLQYEWEAFGAKLNGFDEQNTLQFIKLVVRNTGTKVTEAKIIATVRHAAYLKGPMRERAQKFFDSEYEIRNNQLLRNRKVVCDYPKPNYWEAVYGIKYSNPFDSKNLNIKSETEVGLAYYTKQLAPNSTMELVFKLPRVAVDAEDVKYQKAMMEAEYTQYREATVNFWQNSLTQKSIIHTPGEPKIEQAHRAAAAHVMLGTRTLSDGRTQTDGLPYPNLFISAIYDYGQLYTNFGLDDYVVLNFPHCKARQQPDGLFVDIAVSHGAKIHCAHGQTTAFISDYIVNSKNQELGNEMFPYIRKAVELIENEHNTQPHGLMSPAHPYDNEMIKGQWTSHNLWTIIGLRAAIRLAMFLDEKDIAKEWLTLFNDYEKTVLTAVRESAASDGYVPTGLYDFITGPEARAGFAEYRTDQDWENEMLLWPTELLKPNDPLVEGTLKRLRDTKYREGIMTYRNGQHLHQYITTRAINQYIANRQPKEALTDMYSALLHSGSATESFENMIRPWTDRDVEFCPPPHAWGCCNLSNTIRNLFVMEQGGRGGLEPTKRDLMLFNAVSPVWLVNGKALGIEKAPTSFGTITALMTPKENGADVVIQTDFHTQPHNIVVRIPYFVKLKSFKSDARRAKLKEDVILLSSDATSLSLEWEMDLDADKGVFQNLLLRHRKEVGHWKGKRNEMPKVPTAFLTEEEKKHPNEKLSFKLVLSAWQAEYARRFKEHIKAGGQVKPYFSAPLCSNHHFETAMANPLLLNKVVSCSNATVNHSAKVVNDGIIADPDNYWESDESNAWWQVDIGSIQDISSITVVPYYADSDIYYQFVVKTSVDGENWNTFLDMSDNTKAFGKKGVNYTGQLTSVRYIKIEMLRNSNNVRKQLVEVVVE